MPLILGYLAYALALVVCVIVGAALSAVFITRANRREQRKVVDEFLHALDTRDFVTAREIADLNRMLNGPRR